MPAKDPLAEEYQPLNERLFHWEAYAPQVKVHLSSSAVACEGGLVLIDPIDLADEAVAEMLAVAPPPVAVVLTSGNHWRAARTWARRFAIPIHAHAEAAGEEGTPDEFLAEGSMVAGDLRVIELPGAGPGEIALLHPPGGSLHLGDAVINLATGLSFLPDKYCTDPKRLRESLRKLLREEFRLLLFAHGTPIVSEASGRLARLLA